MTFVETLEPLLGVWRGTNRLRVMPTEDFRQSAVTATIALAARKFVTVAYTWSESDKAQDGMMLVGENGLVWVDSWHVPEGWMEFPREPDEDGVIRYAGVYEKEWGWLIHFDPAAAKITMHNVPPGEKPYLAVEMALGA